MKCSRQQDEVNYGSCEDDDNLRDDRTGKKPGLDLYQPNQVEVTGWTNRTVSVSKLVCILMLNEEDKC